MSFSFTLTPEKQRTTRSRPFPLILQAFLAAGLVACIVTGGSKAMAQTSERTRQKQAAEEEQVVEKGAWHCVRLGHGGSGQRFMARW